MIYKVPHVSDVVFYISIFRNRRQGDDMLLGLAWAKVESGLYAVWEYLLKLMRNEH